jgi:hypothetical protein
MRCAKVVRAGNTEEMIKTTGDKAIGSRGGRTRIAEIDGRSTRGAAVGVCINLSSL